MILVFCGTMFNFWASGDAFLTELYITCVLRSFGERASLSLLRGSHN